MFRNIQCWIVCECFWGLNSFRNSHFGFSRRTRKCVFFLSTLMFVRWNFENILDFFDFLPSSFSFLPPILRLFASSRIVHINFELIQVFKKKIQFYSNIFQFYSNLDLFSNFSSVHTTSMSFCFTKKLATSIHMWKFECFTLTFEIICFLQNSFSFHFRSTQLQQFCLSSTFSISFRQFL